MKHLESLPEKFLENYLKTQPIAVVAVINHVAIPNVESELYPVRPITNSMSEALKDAAKTRAAVMQNGIAPEFAAFLGFRQEE